MRSSDRLFVLALAAAAVLGTSSGHDHENQHSHLCEGAGFNFFCPVGQNLKISKAWYGRIAHDTTSCIGKTPVPNNSSSNSSAGAVAPQPDLAEDCGSSLLASKASWCHSSDKGGCSITVSDLAPEVEERKCPDSVTKYLYLEYECLEATGGAAGGVTYFQLTRSVVCFLLLGLLSSCFFL